MLFPVFLSPHPSCIRLKGALVFNEGQQNDTRMNVHIALTAAQEGAAVANHTEVKGGAAVLRGRLVYEWGWGGRKDAYEQEAHGCGQLLRGEERGGELQAWCPTASATAPHRAFPAPLPAPIHHSDPLNPMAPCSLSLALPSGAKPALPMTRSPFHPPAPIPSPLRLSPCLTPPPLTLPR